MGRSLVVLLAALVAAPADAGTLHPHLRTTTAVSTTESADATVVVADKNGGPTVKLRGVNDANYNKLTPAQKKQVLEQAQVAAGRAVCSAVPGAGRADYFVKQCGSAVGKLYSIAPGVVSVTVCSLLGGVPFAGGFLVSQCQHIIGGLMTGAGWSAFNGTILSGAAKLAQAAVAVGKFIANPSGAIDDLANKGKESATGLINATLRGVTSYKSADLSSAQFRSDYAKAAGIGLAVMGILYLITCMQAAKGSIDMDEFVTAIVWQAPWALLLLVFGPAIGYGLQTMVNGLSQGIIGLTGQSIETFLQNTFNPINQATASAVPGGALVGALTFIALVVGGFGIAINMVMQNFGLYMVSALIGIAFGMRINPKWRSKTRKMEAGWGAILLFKPLFLLLLMIAMGFLNSVASAAGVQGPSGAKTGLPLLMNMLTVMCVLLVLSFAPVQLMRKAPLLPGGNEHGDATGSGGAAALGGAAGNVMTQTAGQRQRAGSSSGGGGGSSSGPSGAGDARGGTESPAPPPAKGSSTTSQGSGQDGPGATPWTGRGQENGKSSSPAPGGADVAALAKKGASATSEGTGAGLQGAGTQGAAAALKGGSTGAGGASTGASAAAGPAGVAIAAGAQVGQAAAGAGRKLAEGHGSMQEEAE